MSDTMCAKTTETSRCQRCGSEFDWLSDGTKVHAGKQHFESDWLLCLERQLNAANDRIKHLRDGIAKQNQTIEQACGKVLGYPWFKDDQKNFPGSTEKDGVCVGDHVAETIVCELVGKYTEALDRIKRLEEAGDALKASGYFGGFGDAVNKWNKAKEAKP